MNIINFDKYENILDIDKFFSKNYKTKINSLIKYKIIKKYLYPKNILKQIKKKKIVSIDKKFRDIFVQINFYVNQKLKLDNIKFKLGNITDFFFYNNLDNIYIYNRENILRNIKITNYYNNKSIFYTNLFKFDFINYELNNKIIELIWNNIKKTKIKDIIHYYNISKNKILEWMNKMNINEKYITMEFNLLNYIQYIFNEFNHIPEKEIILKMAELYLNDNKIKFKLYNYYNDFLNRNKDFFITMINSLYTDLLNLDLRINIKKYKNNLRKFWVNKMNKKIFIIYNENKDEWYKLEYFNNRNLNKNEIEKDDIKNLKYKINEYNKNFSFMINNKDMKILFSNFNNKLLDKNYFSKFYCDKILENERLKFDKRNLLVNLKLLKNKKISNLIK